MDPGFSLAAAVLSTSVMPLHSTLGIYEEVYLVVPVFGGAIGN